MSVSLTAPPPDLLMAASIGGVSFAMIDSRDEVGRRVQRIYFPGRDDTEYQDLGADDGPIRINGLLVGDDYVAQGNAMRTVFRTPGPMTLVHPWIGTMVVVITKRGTVSNRHDEIRFTRITFEAALYSPSIPVQQNTLPVLLSSVTSVQAAVSSFLSAALAPVGLALAAFSVAQGFVTAMANLWPTAILTAGTDGVIITADAATSLAALAAPVPGPGGDWLDTTITNLLAVPVAVAQASVPTPPAVVGPGGSAVTPPSAEPTSSVTVLLAAVTAIQPYATTPAPGPALACAMQAQLVAQAVSAASDIVYTSQQDALAEQAVLLPAIDAAIQAVGAQAQANASATWPLWDALNTLRDAFLSDMNAEIGRLPAVVQLTIPATTSAWLIAQYLSGDNPAAVVATYQDIVTRNSILNPAIVPAGVIEVLQQ